MALSLSLAGKRALITGSTSGIGLAMARAVAEAGADVMLNGLGDPAAIEVIRSGLAEETGRAVLYDGADMTDPAAIAAMVQHAADALGGVDILVNNAGIQHVAPLDAFPVDTWDRILAINLSAAFHATRAVLPGMKERGFGRIVMTGSAHALVASPFKAPYVATKHALAGMAKSVALEVAQQGITVNTICPGYVETDLVKNQIKDTAKARNMTEEQVMRDVLLAAQPTKQFVTPAQVGAFLVFLCSDAAANVTGATLAVDGGWTAQ